jgi:hypothetical protein
LLAGVKFEGYTMDDIGTYEEQEFPVFRNPTVDTLEQGRKKHHIPLLLEIDVTEGRKYLHEIKARMGEGVSFTGWAIKCISQAVSDHKCIHAMGLGRGKIIGLSA